MRRLKDVRRDAGQKQALVERVQMPSDHRLIGLMADQNLNLLTGMMAILKSGHAFVPIDAQHPIERLNLIVRDCALELLVTENRWLAVARQLAASNPSLKHVVCIDRAGDDLSAGAGGVEIHDARSYLDAPPRESGHKGGPTPESLVYVIYTSGSTGVPKGVPISNGNLIPLLLWSRDYFGLGEQTRVLQNLSPCFDFGVYELLTTILFGGTLHFTRRQQVSGLDFYSDFIRKHAINTVHTTPSYFRDVLSLGGGLDTLRIVHLGGEPLSRSAVEKIYQTVGEECAVYNGYGPTEASVNTTIFELKGKHALQALNRDAIPIGRPTANNETYILDGQMRPVAAGIPGELYIGGPGLARGYLARPALTASRFLPDPISGRPGARLYRTGDLARFLENGAIEFLGRTDEQVKLRGFRIELGELEAALLTHPDVVDAAAVVASAHEPAALGREDSSRRLVAFAVLRPEAIARSQAELRSYLRERLPEYMVPAAIELRPALPLNSNGKVDRRRLMQLAAEAAPLTSTSSQSPARTPVEELVAAAWEEVLGVSGVGPDDNFFELGGHSLLATQVVNRLRNSFGTSLPLYLLFERPTLAEFARYLERADWINAGQQAPEIEPAPRDIDLPLSFAQERLWFLSRLEPDSTSYFIVRAIRIHGPLSHEVLEKTFTEMVRRHEVLRTTFPMVDGRPIQHIHAPSAFRIPKVDLRKFEGAELEREVDSLILREGQRPFDLAHGPLLRVTAACLGAEEHVVILNEHHLIHDGWAQGVLIREFLALYRAFAKGEPSPLNDLRLQFADLAYWQRRWMQGDELERQLAYWREQLRGADAGLNLPTDRPRPPIPTFRGEQLEFVIDAELAGQLRALSRRQGATLFMTMLAAFKALLHHHTGQVDISLGSGIANRRVREFEDLIGMMVNTVVLRTDLAGAPSFRELLERVRKVCLGAYSHQDVPFDKVVEALRPERSRGHSPLFQGMFAFMDAPTQDLSLPDLSLSVVETHNRSAKFDFTLIVLPHVEQQVGQRGHEVRPEISAHFEYNADIFNRATMLRMWRRYIRILQAVVSNPELKLAELPLLDDQERYRLLHTCNETQSPLPDPAACAHQLFERWARLTPNAPAIVRDNLRFTYAQINGRANQLAHHLISLGSAPEEKIAICLPRCAESIIAALACFKTGAAYVALDPDYPQQRLEFMIDDSQARIVATTAALAGRFTGTNVHLISLDMDWAEIAVHSTHDPNRSVTALQLAYIIYTSGSTGTPKGVGVEHQGLMNLIAWHQRTYAVTPDDRATMLAGPGFDASVWEVWPYLTAGASLHIPGDEERNSPPRILRWLASQQATLSFLPTPLAAAVLNEPWPEAITLRALLTGGDKLLRRPPRGLGSKIFNHYGPTEYSVVTTSCEVIPDGEPEVPPIGRPIDNTQAYVLDDRMEPVAVGLPGELYIGGAGLARGYLSRPALTAERFLPDALSGRSGARLYRTGDVARFCENGEIEFLGRADRQIKLRGFRIELDEVETALAGHPAVQDAAVIARQDRAGELTVVSYFVPRHGQAVTSAELRAHLKQRLPHYMVPAAVVALDSMPLSPNGKVDRQALPAPVWSRAEDEAGVVGPRNHIEEIVAGIWTQVLGVERVGLHDDFFELGGHSLIATRVAARINETFHIELPLRDVFEAPTVEALAGRIGHLIGAGGERRMRPIERLPRDVPLPLSFAQQRLWFLDQIELGNVAYNIPVAVRLTGNLHIEALERGIGEIIRRHEVLRTTFASVGGQAVQSIAPPGVWRLEMRDLSAIDEPGREAEVLRLAREEARRPFDLARGPLLRAMLWRLSEADHTLLLTIHHIVFDGWSAGILVHELSRLYLAFSNGEPSPLAELPVQYADFAQWQRRRLSEDWLEEHLGYWRGRLSGPLAVVELPAGRRQRPRSSVRAATEQIRFPQSLCAAMRSFNRQCGVTPFMTLLAGLQTLLHRYTGLTDIVIGTPVAGRTHLDVESLIGFFANTLVLRGDLSGYPTFGELLERVRELTIEGHVHAEVPFEMLVQELQPARDLERTPLFQVMLVIQSMPREMKLPDLSVRQLELGAVEAKFDLTLAVRQSDAEMSGHWEYNADRIDGEIVRRMTAHLLTLLERAIAEPHERISRLGMLSEAQRRLVTNEWNDTHLEYPSGSCVHELIEAQVSQTPAATALIDGEERVTYRELNERANRLARHLRALGVGPETVVGILLERKAAMVTALLGVLKAGGAYLPLDPEYPHERLRMMFADARPLVLLTQEKWRRLSAELGANVVCLDSQRGDFEPGAADNLEPGAKAANLAYILYTSGSTGRPKGVAVEHRNAAAFIQWARHRFSAEQLAGVLASTSICFDLSIFEIFVPLSSGGRVILAENALELATLSAAAEVTLINTVPSALHELIRLKAIGERVCAINLAGEPLQNALAQRAYEHTGVRQVMNLYGPSEDTTYSTCAVVQKGSTRPPTIGRPIANTQAYILDSALQPVPPGVTGELYLGGAGLARGYLSRPALTAARFLPDALSGRSGARLYRTGDVARFCENGEIEFLGRADRQIKLRGFRIELDEIETALAGHPAVQDAAVIARQDRAGELTVVSYFVPRHGQTVTSAELRAHLKQRLPHYMVPAAVVALDSMPLSPNGKVDRQALPAPAWSRAEDEAGVVGPRNHIEEIVAGIWTQVLGVERVGLHDDFFELGGHSLIATRVAARINETFHIELPLRNVFEAPTVAALAGRIGHLIGAGGERRTRPIERLPRDVPLPLSFAQQRLWFLAQFEGASQAYHITGGVKLTGVLDRQALRRALNEIVARHETLRTTFSQTKGGPIQVIGPPEIGFQLEEPDLRRAAVPTDELRRLAEREASAPFDLERGPLIRGRLAQLTEDDHALLVTMHHIVSDGWSIGIIINELSALYQASREGKAAELPALPIQYADYAAWQRLWFSGEILQQAAYWKNALTGAPALLELPTDRVRRTEQDYAGEAIRVDLDEQLAGALRALSRRHGATLYVTLLAGWAALLARLSGQDEVVIGSPVANRTRTQIEPLIGFFANTLALRIDLSGAPTVGALLERIKTLTVEAQQHQEIPFEQVVEITQPARSLSHAPIFQVMFAWQNAPEGRIDLPELTISALQMPRVTAIFDLTLSLREAGQGITGALEYATALFDRPTLDRYLGYWRRLLEAMVAEEAAVVDRLPLLTEAERGQLLEQWGTARSAASERGEKFVHELFEEQAQRCPQAVALTYEDEHVSYAQLNVRANRLAHHLRGLSVGPDVSVAICLERGIEMVVALLAVLKAGGAYVPLDPSYPPERLAYMLEDSSPAVILTGAHTPPEVCSILDRSIESATVIDLATDHARWAGKLDTNPDRTSIGLTPEHLAYVIYTSGSTGRPKGVAMSHRPLANLIGWQTAGATAAAPRRCLQFAALGFDVAFQEIFSTLSTGAELELIDNGLRLDFPRLLGHLAERSIERLFLPYSALQALAEAACNTEDVTSGQLDLKLEEIITAGEQLRITPQIAAFCTRLKHPRLYNHYGPTETHVVTTFELPGEVAGWPSLPPIGRPVSNSRIYLLDRQGQPVPVGSTGEIYLAGVQMARSYLQNPAQTAERFLPDPFSAQPGARFYRTGDLGRWRPDGNIEFLGRADRQVKLRGFRVELEEIESALLAHPDVADAAIVVAESAQMSSAEDAGFGRRLVAFAVPRHSAHGLHQDALRSFLRERLPDYMLPAVIAPLPALPLTPSGKIDRVQLTRWAADTAPMPASATASGMTAMEELVAAAWEEVLGLSGVGPGDDFFELGGHSLIASRMISRLREVLRVELPVKRIFQFPTVAELAAWLTSEQLAASIPTLPPIRRVPREQDLPLSFAQQRLWFDHQLAPESAAYNMPAAMRIEGHLNLCAFEKTIRELIRRHEVLRTTFCLKNDGPTQVIHAPLDVPIPIDDLSGLSSQQQARRTDELAAQEASAPFNLSVGPLFRVKLLRLSESQHVVLMTAHHIICDGWSVGLMTQELGQLYQAFLHGDEPQLPKLPVQYADYACWQREQMRGGNVAVHLDYWRRTLSGAFPIHELPTDRPRASKPDGRGEYRHFNLPDDLSRGLRQLSRREGTTLFMTLLAAFDVLLARHTRAGDIVVGSAIAGRSSVDVENLIGCFVNMLVLRTDVSGDPRFRELLMRVKETTLGAYAYQDLPFDLLVDELKPERQPGRSPFFQVAFGLQNQRQPQLDWPGLKLCAYPVKYEAVRYDLTAWICEDADGLSVKWTYRSDLFDPDTIERLQEHYVSLLRSALNNPDARISDLEMLTDAEQAAIRSAARKAADARQEHLARTRRKPIAVLVNDNEIAS